MEAGLGARWDRTVLLTDSELEEGARSQKRRKVLEAAKGEGLDAPPETAGGTEPC